MKRIAYYDKFYENLIYFVLVASVLACLNEVSKT